MFSTYFFAFLDIANGPHANFVLFQAVTKSLILPHF